MVRLWAGACRAARCSRPERGTPAGCGAHGAGRRPWPGASGVPRPWCARVWQVDANQTVGTRWKNGFVDWKTYFHVRAPSNRQLPSSPTFPHHIGAWCAPQSKLRDASTTVISSLPTQRHTNGPSHLHPHPRPPSLYRSPYPLPPVPIHVYHQVLPPPRRRCARCLRARPSSSSFSR